MNSHTTYNLNFPSHPNTPKLVALPSLCKHKENPTHNGVQRLFSGRLSSAKSVRMIEEN